MKNRSLFIIIGLLAALFSCDPPEGPRADFVAVVSFPAIQYEKDIHTSLLVQYPGYNDFSVEHIMPALKGQRYQDTVYLNDVRLDEVVKLDFGVQQGYIVCEQYNEFSAQVYMNGVPIWSTHYHGPDSDFDYLVIEN